MIKDTIVAPATTNMNNAVSVIRLSGSEAVKIADSIFSKNMSTATPRTLVYGKIKDKNNNILDDCLCVKMLAPHSYTGEDTVEFYCHGGQTVSECVIKEIILNGGRLAQKGEFTKRAFLNGKMDLTQAEAVIDIINSETKNSLLMAQNNLNGKLRNKVDAIRKKVMNIIMLIMAGNDFPDETGEDISLEVKESMENVQKEIKALTKSYDKGKIIRDGFTCAICGKPNVGKSSLLNALLSEERAIVTDIEGTTRDVVTERVDIGGYIMNIADTAGLRESDDKIEKIGIEKSYQYMNSVDLVLYVVDSSKALTKEEKDEINSLENDCILVFNKNDLKNEFSRDGIDENIPVVEISAKNNTNIELLTQVIKEKIENRLKKSTVEETIFSQRHFECLVNANEYLTKAIETISFCYEPDIASIDLENCASALGEITGTTVNDEVIDNIFKNFCIGK